MNEQIQEAIHVAAEGIRQKLIGCLVYGKPLDASQSDQIVIAAYWLGKRESDAEWNHYMKFLDEIREAGKQ